MKIILIFFHFNLIFLVAFAFAKKWKAVDCKLFWISFVYRLMAGASLGLVYTYYYSANDTWFFFEDAQRISAVARTDFWTYLKMLIDVGENQSVLSLLTNQDLRSVFFIKIISLFCLISADNYWVCAAYFSLVSFLTSWFLHQKITEIFTGSDLSSALAFLFFPSVVFWSSGIEKEAIALSGIYFLSALFLSVLYKRKINWICWLLVVVVTPIIWNLKYYWAILFFISGITGLFVHFLSLQFLWVKKHIITTLIILFAGGSFLATFTHPNFYFSNFLDVVVSNNQAFAKISNADNLIHYHQLAPGWRSIIENAPWALFSGLFRPFLGEGNGLLGLAASVENFFLLILFLSALFSFRRDFFEHNKITLLAIMGYIIFLCVFLALSTPNLGSLSRYRTGFLPFFVFVISCCNPILRFMADKFGLTRL